MAGRRVAASSEWTINFVVEKSGKVMCGWRGRPQYSGEGREEVLWVPLVALYQGVVVVLCSQAYGREEEKGH